jgi:hypothetical protein
MSSYSQCTMQHVVIICHLILTVLENGLIMLVMMMLGVHRSTRCIKNDSFATD